VSQPTPRDAQSIQAEVERLTAEAKKLNCTGREPEALEVYRVAADLMLGAPWLQQRTAELARKLRQPGVATLHYRRAAVAFVSAGFPKRALSPLRTAWALSVAALPANPEIFVALTLELSEVQRNLGVAGDAAVTVTSANRELDASGCSERVPALTEVKPPSIRRALDTPLPESGVSAAPPLFEARIPAQTVFAMKR
jgi:hypothetical protein